MKAVSIVKKNKLLFLVALAYLVILVISPDKAIKSIGTVIYYLVERLPGMPSQTDSPLLLKLWFRKK